MPTRAEFSRVVFLTHVFPRTPDDPLGSFILNLAQGLAARGVNVTVITPHAAHLPTAESFGAIQVRRFRYAPASWERLAYQGMMHDLVARGVVNKILFALFNLSFFFKTLGVLMQTRPQIIHAQWWLPAGLVGAMVGAVTRTPVVITVLGTDVEMLRRNAWAKRLAQFVFQRAQSIVAISSYLRTMLAESVSLDPARINVMPLAVNPLFENASVANGTHRDHAHTILTVARLSEQKGIHLLLDALSILHERNVAARLVIVGEGEQRAALEQQARELNIAEWVEFAGARAPRELVEYYTQSTVFALPARREGLGLVFAEAQMCGIPVVGTNSGGIPDLIQDNETGLLVPEDDAPALANALQKILCDPALAARLAQAGRARARARFTRTSVTQQLLEIYSNVMESCPQN